MPDLGLVPIEEMVKEIESRTISFVCAYETFEDKQKKKVCQFRYGKGEWFDACKLASILNNDVLNNWAGELTTLQRINDEGVM